MSNMLILLSHDNQQSHFHCIFPQLAQFSGVDLGAAVATTPCPSSRFLDGQALLVSVSMASWRENEENEVASPLGAPGTAGAVGNWNLKLMMLRNLAMNKYICPSIHLPHWTMAPVICITWYGRAWIFFCRNVSCSVAVLLAGMVQVQRSRTTLPHCSQQWLRDLCSAESL